MALIYENGLQLFADGADGGASALGSGSGISAESTGGETPYPEGMPDYAKRYYDAAAKKKQKDVTASEAAQNAEAEQTGNAKPSYRELISSEEYKAEHEKYLQSVIRDRMKSHKAELAKYHEQAAEDREIMSLIGQKYGLDVASDSFKHDLSEAIKADDSVYERYAEEHDVSISEAKRMIGIEQQLSRATKAADERRTAEEQAKVIGALREKGEETKRMYPEFDLDSAMRDERFRRLTAVFGGDTTQAYKALNHDALQKRAVADAEARAQAAVSNAVKANGARPADGGLLASHSTYAPTDFRALAKEKGTRGLREWALQNLNH